MWDTMIQKIKKRLTRWKGSHLSFVGKVCLIKHVTIVAPIFFLSFLKLNNGVKRNEKDIKTIFVEMGNGR